MQSVNVYRNFHEPVECKPLPRIMEDIKHGVFAATVSAIRKATAEGNKDEVDRLKASLPAFTPHATFNGRRKGTNVDIYSNVIHLDFDKLTPRQLKAAHQAIIRCPYTKYCFISPSGNGIKVFVEVPTGIEHHAAAYSQVQAYFEKITGLKTDGQCKDIPRLCFMSHDSKLYANVEAIAFPVNVDVVKSKASAVTATDHDERFAECVAFTENKVQYQDGQRNNFIYRLASNCNRRGIPEEIALSRILQSYPDLPEKEKRSAVRSAYMHHAGEHAKYAKSANGAKDTGSSISTKNSDVDSEPEYDYLAQTPTFPDEIFENLPQILKKGTIPFRLRRERDVALLGELVMMSGCLPNVCGIYRRERYHPHMFSFIVAPAASGKSALKYAARLPAAWHHELLVQSGRAKLDYEAELAEYEKQRRSKSNDANTEKPVKPPFKTVFIPADCSVAQIMHHLHQNGGSGIICDTEADTMTGTHKQDWGDYSHISRKSFHHETITRSRKTDDEYLEIPRPCIAMALSGTPSQVPKLISSAEDGLFSRFCFYAFKNELFWDDPSPSNSPIAYDDHFDELSKEVLKLVEFFQISETEVQLQPHQWQQLSADFSSKLTEVATFVGEDAVSTVFRLGLIMFRLCMILTAIRKYERGDTARIATCSDEDFQTAQKIIDTLLEHSILMYNSLPKQAEPVKYSGGSLKRSFFEVLPGNFTRIEAVEIGKRFGFAERTVDGMLRLATGKLLDKLKPGHYVKL